MPHSPEMLILADRVLARRLERCEAHANAAFVDARASLTPALGATRCDVDGTWAMFDGVGSPLTQTFGLGLFSDVTPTQLEQLETFFTSRGSEVMHEICVMADPGVLPLLGARGYQPIEWSQVLCQTLSGSADTPSAHNRPLVVRRTTLDEADSWADLRPKGGAAKALNWCRSSAHWGRSTREPPTRIVSWRNSTARLWQRAHSTCTKAWPCWPAPVRFRRHVARVHSGHCSTPVCSLLPTPVVIWP